MFLQNTNGLQPSLNQPGAKNIYICCQLSEGSKWRQMSNSNLRKVDI